jgi:hypothetical protein
MTDRDIYMKLAIVAKELNTLAEAAETYVGEAALQAAAATLSGTAKAIYDHCLNGGEDGVH